MKTNKTLITLAICGMIAATSGCNKDGAAAAAKTPTVDAVPVEVAAAARKPVSASYSGTAALVADHEAQVTAKTAGTLKKLYVEEGMFVKAGQLLAELDDSDTRAKAMQAEAQMHKSEATFSHAEAAAPKHLIPQFEYEQDKYELAAQRAAYEAAKLQLSYTRILAPVDGIVAERSFKLGNMVQANQAVFRIVGMDPLQAVLNVPERQLGILKPGQAVELQADALGERKFQGAILRVAPVVDANSGTFRVTCEFRGQRDLKPGMFGRIDIVYDHHEDALTVPRSAVIEEDGETAVFVVDKAPPGPAKDEKKDEKKADAKADGKAAVAVDKFVAHRKLVKLGYSDGDKVEIRSGIDEGTRVITVGRNAVRDGTSVQVLNASTDADKEKALAAAKVAGAQG